MNVGRFEVVGHCVAARHRPNAAGANHAENGLAAILRNRLVYLIANGAERLIPADSLPTGVFAFGVGALKRMLQSIGMIGRLQRRLRFAAAIAAGVPSALIAFDFHRTTVFHGYPHAALHLAACTAAGANPLNLRRSRPSFDSRQGLPRPWPCRHSNCPEQCTGLDQRAPRHC